MIHDLAATGFDERAIARRLDIGVPAVRKALAGAPQAQRGRPALVVPTPEEARILKAAHVRSNRARGQGSMTLAARMTAQTSDTLSPALRDAILKPRASKHTLTSVIKRSMRANVHVINYHRAPNDVTLGLGDVPGQLRMSPRGDRLRAGERESWDDGSINFCVCVPWPWGGDKCSDRHGVRVGRFQLLAGIDDATHACAAFTFTIRPAGSYRAEDVVATCGRAWRDNHRPDRVIFERATWEADQVTQFLQHAGVACDRAHSPHTKLVENWWNQIWSILSLQTDGQIGRYRGEMKRENDLLAKCQSGTLDPRTVFPALPQAIDHIEAAIHFRNHEPVESRTYGQWIPAERYNADLDENPRPALDPAMSWTWAPVQRTWTVRGGLLRGMIPSPVGFSFPYVFAAPELANFERAKVRVFFDPHDGSHAALVLEEPFQDLSPGHVITTAAQLISDVPTTAEAMAGLAAGRTFGGAQRAIETRKLYHALVRREYRSLGLRAQRKTTTEIRDGLGTIARVETGQRHPADTSDPPHPSDPRTSAPSRERIDLSRRNLTSRQAEPDLSTRISIPSRGRLGADAVEAAPRRNPRAALLTSEPPPRPQLSSRACGINSQLT